METAWCREWLNTQRENPGLPSPTVPNLPPTFSSESLGISESVLSPRFTGDKHQTGNSYVQVLQLVACETVALA